MCGSSRRSFGPGETRFRSEIPVLNRIIASRRLLLSSSCWLTFSGRGAFRGQQLVIARKGNHQQLGNVTLSVCLFFCPDVWVLHRPPIIDTGKGGVHDGIQRSQPRKQVRGVVRCAKWPVNILYEPLEQTLLSRHFNGHYGLRPLQ